MVTQTNRALNLRSAESPTVAVFTTWHSTSN